MPTIHEELTDATLLDAVRAGNLLAYGVLCQRHAGPAEEFALRLAGDPGAAHDLTARALTGTVRALRRGDGPRWSLRPHLLGTIRRLATEDPAAGVAAGDPAGLAAEDAAAGLATRGWAEAASQAAEATVRRWHAQLADPAFRQLPPRWQLVLWHLEAGPTATTDLAAVLGTSPGGAAALIRRAREDLSELDRRPTHNHREPDGRHARQPDRRSTHHVHEPGSRHIRQPDRRPTHHVHEPDGRHIRQPDRHSTHHVHESGCCSTHHQLRTWFDGTPSHRHLDEHVAGCVTCLSTSVRLLTTRPPT
ncbi:RNA polymerase sigma factor [Amycolatopsis sp. 195334CR]|uniref:RNA polymerase sigma factor n=1 Tax=Amycolatopsis sp. 195334CR TaxID=2814588 RepID=UPI001A8E7820|nr:hypothetical protein [Amycolatopsis sp. 195334CR]MBN6040279.1 hypothetical protein [Amycolatopsis sp. 195334CR]